MDLWSAVEPGGLTEWLGRRAFLFLVPQKVFWGNAFALYIGRGSVRLRTTVRLASKAPAELENYDAIFSIAS